jgi:hypothetical protein
MYADVKIRRVLDKPLNIPPADDDAFADTAASSFGVAPLSKEREHRHEPKKRA